MVRFFTRAVMAIALVTMVFGGLTIAPQPASAYLWTPDANECAFLTAINKYRRDNGVGPLTLSRDLGMAAEDHSLYMARTDDVDHTIGTLSWADNILDYGYPAGLGMGENVLAGRQSAGGALGLWKTSPPHNANMLDPSWHAIGIARAYNPKGRYVFYWTTDFGTRSHRTISC